ncbi:MAG: 50S ribosomal protein L23 [Puniceicoccales bacterium]|jgi:large subunit ribosomal protein L23|nr:50S ribosomal protein L23 [Puniceicoccales bacterium]
MKKFNVLKEILLTEKSNMLLSESRRYVFVVDASANKRQVADAVGAAFGVKVVDVNIINYRGKAKRVRSKARNRYTIVGARKKAIVALRDGDKIDVV